MIIVLLSQYIFSHQFKYLFILNKATANASQYRTSDLGGISLYRLMLRRSYARFCAAIGAILIDKNSI